MSRILLVEDEPKVAAFVKKGLEEEGYRIDLVGDGLEGKEQALANPYDLLILDVMLPGMGGVEVCRQVRAQNPALPILMLTALGTTSDKVLGLNSGADDYLTKPFAFAELLARVKALSRRATSGKVKAEVLRAEDLEMNCTTRMVKRSGQILSLSTREFMLLEYLLRNKNSALTRLQLSKDVWNIPYETGTNFVDVYVSYLRNKIDKPFSKKLIYTMAGIGYMLKDESAA